MALTRTLRGASSSANPFVSVSMAPFVDAYSRAPATGCEPTMELRLMMLPPSAPNRLIAACTVRIVLGTILTVQAAIKRFGADGGSIINLSSIVGSHPVAGALLYASTKGAIETLTKGLALELAPRKVRVNAIAPGHTETEGNVAAGTFEGGAGAVLAEKTPLGRLGRVSDIAPLAVFLASDESAWITGEIIRAAGGLVVAT